MIIKKKKEEVKKKKGPLRKIDLLNEQKDFLVKNKASAKAITEVEVKIAASKRGRSSKNKGANYEREVAKRICERFPQFKLCRTKQSGGAHKDIDHEHLRGDLTNLSDSVFPFGIEIKNQKTWKLKDWWRQCASECSSGKIPLLIYHQGQEIVGGKVAQKADDFVMLRLSDMLDIIESYLGKDGGKHE